MVSAMADPEAVHLANSTQSGPVLLFDSEEDNHHEPRDSAPN
jgi:hypothetical protein